MDIDSRIENGIAIITLAGRFDAHQAKTIKQQLLETIDSGRSRVVINLKDVNFVDSAGLAVLVQAMKHCRQGAGELRLCHLQTPVVVILEMSGLDRALAIHTNEQDAINAFATETATAH